MRVRRLIHERFDLSLGTGLGKVKGRMFRIGHLGDSNDLTLVATVAGCEMGLKLAGVPAGRQRRAGGDGALREPRGAERAGTGGLTAPTQPAMQPTLDADTEHHDDAETTHPHPGRRRGRRHARRAAG